VSPQLTGVRHKGSQCITEKLLLVKFHFFGVHFDGPWANGEGAPPLPVLDEVRRTRARRCHPPWNMLGAMMQRTR